MDKYVSKNTENTIYSAKESRKDAVAKNILRDRTLLSVILKAIISEYKDISEADIASKYIEPETILNSEGTTVSNRIRGLAEEDPMYRESNLRFDELFNIKIPTKRNNDKALIDLEIQNVYSPGYPILKRAILYAAKELCSECRNDIAKFDYNSIYKVYSIWICFDAPKMYENTVVSYRFTEKDISGHISMKEEDYNLIETVIINLSKDSKMIGDRLIDTLHTIFCVEDKNEVKERLNQLELVNSSFENEVNSMIDWEEFYMQRGEEKGIQKGKEEGFKLGKEQGINETKNQIKLMKEMEKNGKTFAEIAEKLGIPEEEVVELIG